MKLFTTALFSLAALHQLADAWTITPSDVATSSAGGNEAVTKTWTISGDAPHGDLQLRGLGRVFVSHDESLVGENAFAKVVLSGSEASLLETFEVTGDGDGIQLRLKNEEYEGQGYLLTRVYVAKKQSILGVTVLGSNDVVVAEDALPNTDPAGVVSLNIAGSGDLYVGAENLDWSVKSFAGSIAGSGDLQVLAQSLQVEQLVLSVAGSGDIGVVANNTKITKSLVSSIAGSGDIHVQTNDLQVQNLTTSVAGTGDVTYANKGSCQEQRISLVGSGDVSAGSIVCVNTKVDILGSGDALVQTTGNLTVSSLLGGVVSYYGATPSHINVADSSFFGRKKTKKPVKQARENYFDEYEISPVPKPAPMYIVLKTDSTYFSNQPRVRYELETDEYDKEVVEKFLAHHQKGHSCVNLQVQSLAVHSAHHVSGLLLFAVVGGAFVAVGVAAKKYQTLRQREKYDPLV